VRGIAWGLALALTAALAGCSSSPAVSGDLVAGLTPDEVKYLEDAAQAVRRTAQCLRERGWNITTEADGWGVTDLAASQVDAYEADAAACQDATGMATMDPLPDTPERMRRLYAYEVELAECLRDQGVDVPPAPSEQAFIDRYQTDDAWFAYAFADPASYGPDRWAALESTCPPYGAVGRATSPVG
jgi:hypothetical protein